MIGRLGRRDEDSCSHGTLGASIDIRAARTAGSRIDIEPDEAIAASYDWYKTRSFESAQDCLQTISHKLLHSTAGKS